MKESLLKARLGNEKYNAIKKTSLSQISKNIIDNFNTILDTLKLNEYTEDQMNMRKKEIKEELISKCKPKPKDEILEKLTERALNNEIEERRIARKQIKQMFIARFLLQPVKENWKASLDSPIRSLLLDGEALISTKFKKNVMGTLDTSLLTKKIPELDKISKEYFELTFDEVCDGYIPHLNALVETSRLHKEQPLQLTFDTLKEKAQKSRRRTKGTRDSCLTNPR